jgi:hypothetical protein
MVRLKHRRLWRRSSVCRVHSPLELSHGVIAIIRGFGDVICIPSAVVDELWRIRYLLTCSHILDETRDIFLYITVLQRQADRFARL